LYAAENWTLRKLDQRHPAVFEMWCWRRTERKIRTDNVRSWRRVTKRQKTKERRKASWIGHIFRTNCFLKHVI